MPDYNYDGFDDFTGQWVGIGGHNYTSSLFGNDDDKKTKKPKLTENEKKELEEKSKQVEELRQKYKEVAIIINDFIVENKFNTNKDNQKYNLFEYNETAFFHFVPFYFCPVNLVGRISIYKCEDHSFKKGIIFKEKIDFFRALKAGEISFTIDENKQINYVNVTVHEPRHKLQEETIKDFEILTEKLNSKFKIINKKPKMK